MFLTRAAQCRNPEKDKCEEHGRIFHMIVISAVFHSSRAVDVGSAVSGDLECKYACLNWVTSCSLKPATEGKVTS